MRRYKVEYTVYDEHDSKDNFAVVEARSMVNAREAFLYEYAGIDPEIDGISPYRIYDEIQAERLRQITEEGYPTEHDDKLTHDELVLAAGAYAFSGILEKILWPFKNPIKKKDSRRNLIHAAALLVAEIERLNRLNKKGVRPWEGYSRRCQTHSLPRETCEEISLIP